MIWSGSQIRSIHTRVLERILTHVTICSRLPVRSTGGTFDMCKMELFSILGDEKSQKNPCRPCKLSSARCNRRLHPKTSLRSDSVRTPSGHSSNTHLWNPYCATLVHVLGNSFTCKHPPHSSYFHINVCLVQRKQILCVHIHGWYFCTSQMPAFRTDVF